MKTGFPKIMTIAVAALLFAGCSVKYAVKDPDLSGVRYERGAAQPAVMKVVDQRSSKVFQENLAALSRASIKLENIDDPIAWLSRSLEKELSQRGVAVKVVDQNEQGPADVVLIVKKFQIANRRVNSWAPWESYHSFRGEVIVGDKTTEIHAYFFNGKVPMWSMKEVEETCINMPLSLVVKEIASKINKVAFRGVESDAQIRESASRAEELAKKKDDNACFPLFELGGSNNPAAMKTLVSFADYGDRFVRACALSAMGTLGAWNQVGFLKMKYAEYDEIDKYMALKSIGDIGNNLAMDFVKDAKTDPLYEREFAFKYCVDLYLEK